MFKNNRDKLNELYGFKKPPVPVEGGGGDGKGFTKWWRRWWEKRHEDVDKKRMFWYVVLIFLCYGISKVWDEGYIAAGIVAILVLHAIWGIYYKEISLSTKAIVGGLLLAFVLGWLVPETRGVTKQFWEASKRDLAEKSIKATEFLKKYKDGKTVEAVEVESQPVKQSVVVPAGYRPETRVIEVMATEDKFTEVKIPPGSQFSIDCPSDGLAKVFHHGAPEGIIHDCKDNIEVGENLHNFRIGFSSKTETPVKVRVKISS